MRKHILPHMLIDAVHESPAPESPALESPSQWGEGQQVNGGTTRNTDCAGSETPLRSSSRLTAAGLQVNAIGGGSDKVWKWPQLSFESRYVGSTRAIRAGHLDGC